MPDNVPITAGTGTNIATDDRGADGHVQRVEDVSSSDYANGQVAPTTSAGTLVAARANRKLVTVVNHGAVDVFVGKATVTTANGVKVKPGAALDFYSTALLQAITASGTGDVHYVEYFDVT